MAPQSREDKVSLVLTIFRGENFVCKTASGFRCQIEAKCGGQALESGVYSISSTNSEPSFNFQLAWQFTSRQLKELRANKISVKVRCILINDKDKPVADIGYAVLFVKDAFPSNGEDVDASKAKKYPLLGTKDGWKIYQPKLLMQLHTEDFSIENVTYPNVEVKFPSDSSKPKQRDENKPKEIDNIDTMDKTPRVELIPETNEFQDRFSWSVSKEDGCFQLGKPSDHDDLYIFNITIVSVSNLHLLWNGRSPKKAASNDYVWQIRYKAYGCEIKSDPFVLSLEDNDRKTFIGDKATARIRAYSPYFCEYLAETAVDFHVLRYELSPDQSLINEEVMGLSLVELKDLAETDTTELQEKLEIMSEYGYNRSVNPFEKPEVRVIFQLEAAPSFFANSKSLSENPSKNDINENVVEIPSTLHINPNDTIDNIIQEINELSLVKKQSAKSKGQSSNSESESDEPEVKQSPSPNKKSKTTQFSQEVVRDFFKDRQKLSSENQQTSAKLEKAKPQSSSSDSDSQSESELQTSNKPNVLDDIKYEPLQLPTDSAYQTADQLRFWQLEKKEEFQRELKKKERAYLRILAEEAASRDQQREKIVSSKLSHLKKKDKELRHLEVGLSEREEQVKRKEMEAAEKTQRATLDSTACLENAKLAIRKLQEEHKIEISSLRRRNEEYEAELKKCKGKLEILQIKLEEKEEYLNKWKAEKYQYPDTTLSEKFKLLEQENKLLKKQVIEIERSKDQYKKQSQALCLKLSRLQDERDRQLKDENENLRLHILANKEHKELKKERRAVADLSHQIKTLQDHRAVNEKPQSDVIGRKSEKSNKAGLQREIPLGHQSSNENEIKRLSDERRKLLDTGAYTKYDMVIKEMERRMIGLAENRNVQ